MPAMASTSSVARRMAQDQSSAPGAPSQSGGSSE